jgi:hypothetical protein
MRGRWLYMDMHTPAAGTASINLLGLKLAHHLCKKLSHNSFIRTFGYTLYVQDVMSPIFDLCPLHVAVSKLPCKRCRHDTCMSQRRPGRIFKDN